MRSRLTFWLALLTFVSASISPPAVYAQFSPWLKNCAPFPTFADEIQARLSEEQPRATEEKSLQPKVHIVAVIFKGEIELPQSVRAQVSSKLGQTTFERDSRWLEASREVMMDVLRDHGYLRARVTTRADVLSRNAEEERVSLTFEISESPQYRLTEIKFADAHVFPPGELRKQFPLQDGDIFDLSGIRIGIERLTRMYGKRGYINFTAEPDLRADNAHHRVSVTMNLNEDRQFKVGKVEILGFEKEVAAHALKMTLKPGEVFNCERIDDFYKENEAILRATIPLGEFKDRVQIGQNAAANTVTVVFDLRHCP